MKQADKQWCLEKAIEITKEQARGGSTVDIALTLKELYEKLKELGEDAWADSIAKENE